MRQDVVTITTRWRLAHPLAIISGLGMICAYLPLRYVSTEHGGTLLRRGAPERTSRLPTRLKRSP